jgi:predicted transcriptional regulator of viral defense system
MKNVEKYKSIFERYGGMMRTKQLQAEGILYRPLQKLIEQGYVEKVRYGYYQWIDHEDFSEVSTVTKLFPDAVLCMDTALRYFGYSDRTPADWHLAVSKDSGKSRFKIDYPFVKPYYVEPSLLELGLTTGEMDGHKVRIYDKNRVICDCLRYRNKMDKEIFNKAIQNYIADPSKNVLRLLEYAEALRVKKVAKDLIGVWL